MVGGQLRADPYERRVVDDELDELCAGAAAIALEGAKAVGKSTTAAERARAVFPLEDPTVRDIVAAAPERLLTDGPVLIDEWQKLPSTWDVVRRAVDDGAAPGQFLLTGSASEANPGTHSGAGRILSVRMRPLSLAERHLAEPTVPLQHLLGGGRPPVAGRSPVALDGYVHEIVASGFPGIRAMPGRVRRAQLRGYVDRVIDRDFPEYGRPVRNPAALRRWLAAYAAATATAASYETIREAATSGQGEKPSKTTTLPYRDTLERLYVLDPLPAWLPTGGHLGELGAAPKHHLVDPALATTVLGLGPDALLSGDEGSVRIPRDGTFLGGLFESLVALSTRIYAQAAEATVSHLRSHRGAHEVDLIVERDDGRVVALEVKLGGTVRHDDVKHLRWLGERLGDRLLDAVVITTGPEAYRRPDGVAVVPAALLGP
ncbi:MAG: ATP-binding protein [Acidimicrobiia bacterium]